jgi:D-alanine-D-alanine ligase
LDPYADFSHLWPSHLVETVLIEKAKCVQQILQLVKSKKYDVFVNLCDGAWDEDRAGAEVVTTLEKFNVPYTGARPAYYEPSKEQMKKAAYYAGVNTADFVFAYDMVDVERAAGLSFPVIVKHHNGYSSIGMTRASKCENMEEARVQAKQMIDNFGGALIEEFVDGPEYTCLVADCYTATGKRELVCPLPVECSFPEGESFKHFEMKWVSHGNMGWKQVEDRDVCKQLQDMTKKIYVALHGNSYGRCDFRQDKKTGKIYMLEINPNCGLFYSPNDPGSADCILMLDTDWSQAKFLELILKTALRQHTQRNQVKAFRVAYTKGRGYGLYANRDLAEGELVDALEEEPVNLVTLSHVRRSWTKELQETFSHYAWPITDELYAIWSKDDTQWKPINHSCDPNTWLTGLNVHARRPIKRGEELTLDYATFCGTGMAGFDCQCGASKCRRRIEPTDYLEGFVCDQYGDHVSDYVRTKRRTDLAATLGPLLQNLQRT